MHKILCILLLLSINLSILYPIANISFLPEGPLIAYVITRIWITLHCTGELLFKSEKEIGHNKKFYYFYWLRILLFYKEYTLYVYLKSMIYTEDTGTFKDAPIKETFYDYVVDKLCSIVKINFGNDSQHNKSTNNSKRTNK